MKAIEAAAVSLILAGNSEFMFDRGGVNLANNCGVDGFDVVLSILSSGANPVEGRKTQCHVVSLVDHDLSPVVTHTGDGKLVVDNINPCIFTFMDN